MSFVRLALAFLAAVVVCAGLGSIFQTQFNLAAVASLGAPVPLAVRLQTTAHDLVHFAPGLAALSAVALAIALSAAGLLIRLTGGPRAVLYGLAGAAGIGTLVVSMNLVLGITPIAATRQPAGIGALAAAGALAGMAFAWLYRHRG